jgi:hypothetical protein
MTNLVKTALKQAYYSPTFNKWGVRLYATLNPPPYLRPRMEFDYDVWNGICTFYSQGGRQIGENNTNPEVYRELIETEHKVCKFEGSRYGLPINVTALRDVMAVWDDALQFTALARNLHIQQLKLDSPRFNLRQGYVFSKLGAAIPAYLARRKKNPIKSGTLPPLETAFFTLGVGPFMVVRALMEKGNLVALDPEPMSPERLYELADTSGSIVSAGGKGCAGSKKLFIDLLDVAMNGIYKKELNSKEARRAVASIDDWDEFYAYVLASSRLELLVKVSQYLCAQILLALQGKADGLGSEAKDLIDASLAGCYHRVPNGPNGPNGLDDRTVMSNFIEIALALLDECHYPVVRGALDKVHLIGPGSLANDLHTLPAGQAQRRAAHAIDLVLKTLQPHCQAQLDGVNAALGQYQDTTVTTDDLRLRIGGKSLDALSAQLALQPA